MDPRIQKLIDRLRTGPYDVTAIGRVREELTIIRELVAASGDLDSLRQIVAMLDAWAQSARDRAASSLARFEAGNLCEGQLGDIEGAIQRYASSLDLNASNMEPFNRLVPLLRNQGNFERLETILDRQAKALAGVSTVQPSVRVEVLREIAKACLERNRNPEGAIRAYEEVVDLEPDLSDVKELARLLSIRGKAGDSERAADLYYTMGDVLGEPDGIEMVSKALDLNPGHEEALALLEQWTPPEERFRQLKYRWAAYLEKVRSGREADDRRRVLAQAYAEAGDFQKGIDCIAPLFHAGDAAAKEIHIKLRAGLDFASTASRPQPPLIPKTAEAAPSGQRVIKKTMLGYKVEAPSPAAETPVAATGIPSERAASQPQANRFPLPSTTTDPNPPKPPPITALLVPSAAQAQFSQPPEAARPIGEEPNRQSQPSLQPDDFAGEPPIAISVTPEELHEIEDESIADYQTQLRKKSRLPWIIGAVILALGATGFAIFQGGFFASVGSREAKESATQESAALKTKQAKPARPIEPPATPKTAGEKTPEQKLEERQPTVEGETQQKQPPAREVKPREPEKKAGPSVELQAKRAKFKGGKIDKEKVIDALEKNLLKIERCYSAALKRKRNLKGRLTFAWTIKKNGYVYGAKDIQSTIKEKKMVTCIKGVLNRIRYARPKGQNARVIMPFVFEPP
ncbi:MAG: AgmX/PglI C-terminal domain-containing protein [Deltaproteobacteria bacterium]|nr:AgmX/PglI C-terminal domain-containing protein [Deltaproteobacteria bacterium]